MGSRRSKGKKEGRTSEMHDTSRGGLDRHSDNRWSNVATESSPAISGLATRKFLTAVRRALW